MIAPDGKFYIETLCAAFKLAGKTIIPWHGDIIDYSTITAGKLNDIIYCGFNMVRNDEIYRSDGVFIAGVLLPFVYSTTAKKAIEKIIDFEKLGLNSDLTIKYKMPFTIGGISFLEWEPLGYQGQSETTGQNTTYYFLEDRINITFRIP